MPVDTGSDSKGCFAKWGDSGKKYYYPCGDKAGLKKAKDKASQQGQTAKTSGFTENISAPEEVISILNEAYKNANTQWDEKRSLNIAWAAVEKAGWKKDKTHNWKKTIIKKKESRKFMKTLKTLKSVSESINMFEATKDNNIDEEKQIVKNVCIMGTPHSKNGYTYSDKAMETLAQLSEKAPLFMNHPTKKESEDTGGVRSMYHWGGVFFNSRKEGDKVFADLKVRGDENWKIVRDVAIMKPDGFGNSINSRVKVFRDGEGQESIIDIAQLKSIDMVTRAATTTNLFESEADYEDIPTEDMDSFCESLADKDEPNQNDFEKYMEGILQDKILEKRIKSVIRDLQWETQDIINDVLRDKEKNIEEKKTEISAILDDLDKEINSIMSIKIGKSTEEESKKDATETYKEENMDFTKLTIEQIKSERPDLVDTIESSVKDADRVTNLEGDVLAKTTELTETKEAFETLTKESTTLKSENDTLKKELDEYKLAETRATKEAFISAKIEETELPKDAISEYFKKDLMTKDEDAIEAAILDRKEAWSGKIPEKKVVINSGTEFVIKKEAKATDTDPIKSFVTAMKR